MKLNPLHAEKLNHSSLLLEIPCGSPHLGDARRGSFVASVVDELRGLNGYGYYGVEYADDIAILKN
jgi:hypothetical protein